MTTLKRTRPASLDLSPNALHSEHETDNVELLPRLLSTATGQPSLEDESIGNSSDTPLFSSDDHPASAENYLDYQCKRQRKGPWWDSRIETQQPIIRSKSKREFRRNLDSGVWMGSDAELEDDVGELAMHDQIRKEPSARRTMEDPGNFDGPVFPYWDSQPVSTEAFWRTQKAAIMEISRCIDHGKESVDLSDLGLFKLQESTLEPLHFLVAERSFSQTDAKSQTFETLIPNLQLYLAYNLLFQLPGQLFKLQNLTVLSLRHNNLTEIPSAIGDLVNLQELNLIALDEPKDLQISPKSFCGASAGTEKPYIAIVVCLFNPTSVLPRRWYTFAEFFTLANIGPYLLSHMECNYSLQPRLL